MSFMRSPAATEVLTIDSTLAVSPAPLPPSLPPPLRAPGIWMALGWIAFYFALQVVGGGIFALMLALVRGQLHTLRGLMDVPGAIHRTLQQPGMQAVLVMLVLSLAAATIMLLIRHRWPRLWSLAHPPGFGFVRPQQMRFLLLAAVIGLATPLVGGWLTHWLAQGHPVTQNISQLGESTPLGWRIPLVVLVVSLGPLVEELLFRGVLLSALMQRWGSVAAIGLSSLVFALAHLPGLDWQVVALPDLLLLAVALAWLRLRSGSIWPSVVGHSANNLLAVAAWFVAVHPVG